MQEPIQLCGDCGGHLQQTWSSGPEEGISGWHPDTGKQKGLHSGSMIFFPLHVDNVFVWPSQVVDHKLYGSRTEFDSTINTVLEEFGVELVCLAGFMRILTGTFVKKWNGMVIYSIYY